MKQPTFYKFNHIYHYYVPCGLADERSRHRKQRPESPENGQE